MENGKIRVIEWIVGEDESGTPLFRHRLEQLWDGHWVTVPVFLELADKSLVER